MQAECASYTEAHYYYNGYMGILPPSYEESFRRANGQVTDGPNYLRGAEVINFLYDREERA
jgi:hypothetical protein